MNRSQKDIELDAKIAEIRRKNEERLKKEKLIKEEVEEARKRNAVVNISKPYVEEEIDKPTLYADSITSIKRSEAVYNSKGGAITYPNSKSLIEDKWREDRNLIDYERIDRRKSAYGWVKESYVDKKMQIAPEKSAFGLKSQQPNNARRSNSPTIQQRVNQNENSFSEINHPLDSNTNRKLESYIKPASKNLKLESERSGPVSKLQMRLQTVRNNSSFGEERIKEDSVISTGRSYRNDSIFSKCPHFADYYEAARLEKTYGEDKSSISSSDLSTSLSIDSIELRVNRRWTEYSVKPLLDFEKCRNNFKSCDINVGRTYKIFQEQLGCDQSNNLVVSFAAVDSKPSNRVIKIIPEMKNGTIKKLLSESDKKYLDNASLDVATDDDDDNWTDATDIDE